MAMEQMLSADHRDRISAACTILAPKLSWDAHVDRLMEIYRSVPAT